MTKLPLVSVITVVKNGEKTIQNCIDSVLLQTYNNFEYIIVDGISSDLTDSIIKKNNSSRIIYLREADNGLYDALNKAINLSSGEYYLVVGCDDAIYENAITDLVRYSINNDIIFGLVDVVDEFGKIIKKIPNHSAGTLIKKDLHVTIGDYDTSYKIAADTLFLEKVKNKFQFKYIDIIVGKFTLGGVSSTSSSKYIEHARAMYESKAWTKIYCKYWLYSRRIFSNLKLFIAF